MRPTSARSTCEHDLVAYQRRRTSTNEVFEVVPLDFPPRDLTTRACWYTVPLDVLVDAGVEPGQVIGAVHAAEHALIGLLPLFAICDRWDVGGVSMALHPQTGDPTIFVYDGYPGGAGIAELAFADVHALVARRARARVGMSRATTGARRACSRRSAATGTSTSTSRPRSSCSRCSAPPASPDARRRRDPRVPAHDAPPLDRARWCSSPSASGSCSTVALGAVG